MYLEEIDSSMKSYFDILEPEFPLWLIDYIETPEMQKQKNISITCGTIYSNLFESKYFVSSLDHGVAVALIVWHFTHDKKQTLAGLFHDIATPAFKHCVDFMYGDYVTQESTEEKTRDIIEGSKEIMSLLYRDNITVDECYDYHIYSIADNDTPKLSADRLEYSLSNALFTYRLLSQKEIYELYNDIVVFDCDNSLELGFCTIKLAERFVEITSKLSVIYREDRTRYSMQLMAEIMKRLNAENVISIDDLYNHSEKEIIEIIESSKYAKIFDIWENSTKVSTTAVLREHDFCVNLKTKVRYIDPLINNVRSSKASEKAKTFIANNLAYKMDNIVYIEGIKFDE